MKKLALILSVAMVAMGMSAVASADDHDHHHPVCHNVKVHGHWHKQCR